MKIIPLFVSLALLAACSTSGPVSTNPDRSTTTEGTAGSAKMTDGAAKEGMTTSKIAGEPDSAKRGRDSLPPLKER
ncbi:MAG: hypothetical protein INR73_22840 [Williamsia sp.]|nr:hypothetical protein [Williamsia sp.]